VYAQVDAAGKDDPTLNVPVRAMDFARADGGQETARPWVPDGRYPRIDASSALVVWRRFSASS
jgi:hypothetical protein